MEQQSIHRRLVNLSITRLIIKCLITTLVNRLRTRDNLRLDRIHLFLPLAVFPPTLRSLRKVPELGNLIQHRLQLLIADLPLQRRDQRARFFCRVAA